jgi:parallel beta-helix repeat protein
VEKVLLHLSVNVFLAFVLLSGALIFCFSDMQRTSATESILSEYERGNSSENGGENSSISLADAREQVVSSAESISLARNKLSRDLLQLIDERYLSGSDSPETLRARMVKLGQLSQADPFSRRASSSAGNPGNHKGPKENSGEPSFSSAEKVYVYIYLDPSANSSVLDSYCQVAEKDEKNHIAVAWVPLESIVTLVSLPEVKSIQTVLPPFVRQKNTVSEGELIFKSSSLRESYGINGTGIKIGIISNGVDKLEDAQSTGDISSDVHVLSNKRGGNEGTSMLEIIQDIAPGAELYFHDCGSSRLEFNGAVDALVNEGCTVICDDMGWLSEPFFEDGIVADHVKEVIKEHDLLYISSAGNSGDSHYQGVFYDNGSGWHDFSRGQGNVKDLQLEIQPSGEVWVFFQWNDRWKYSGNNYDLYLKNVETSETLASSEVLQDGDNLPFEYIMYTNGGNSTLNASIKIKKTSGEARELELYIYYWSGVTVNPENIVAEDSIFGHPAVPEVVTVGAVRIGESGNYEAEYFSSTGPVTISYPSPEVRPKADLSGPDGVNVTGTDGISKQFYGTSASSPHVAAVAALIWSAFPEKSAMDIKRLLYTSSTDLGDPGYDTTFGYGLVDAYRMYEQASEAPSILTVNPDGNGNFSSISEAINNSRPEDSILVYPGTYRENIDVPWALNLSSVSGNPENTILEAKDPYKPVFHVTANSVNISGFSINGYSMTAIYLESAGTCTLANNVVSGFGQGIMLEKSSNNTLSGNKLSNNTEGLRLTDSFQNAIFENEFDNNVNINESFSQNSSANSGRSNTWNTTAEVSYLYNSGIYGSSFGNFYSDYEGQDADGSGIGDIPYGNDSSPLIARLASYSTGFEIGNTAPAQDPVSIEGDTQEFGILSTRNCTFSWFIDGVLLQTNESVSSAVLSVNTGELINSITKRDLIAENGTTASLTAEYNLTVLAANGSSTLQHSWNWTIYPEEEDTEVSGNTGEDKVIRGSSSAEENEKISGDVESRDSGAIASSSKPSVNIESKELVQNSSFKVTGQKQSKPLQFSSHTPAQNNLPETGPDGAPEVWIVREKENNLTEKGSKDSSKLPFLNFGMSLILLLAGALWIKKK